MQKKYYKIFKIILLSINILLLIYLLLIIFFGKTLNIPTQSLLKIKLNNEINNGFILLKNLEKNISNDKKFYSLINCSIEGKCEKTILKYNLNKVEHNIISQKDLFLNLNNENKVKINSYFKIIENLSSLSYTNNFLTEKAYISFGEKINKTIKFMNLYYFYNNMEKDINKLNFYSYNIYIKLLKGNIDLNTKIFFISYITNILNTNEYNKYNLTKYNISEFEILYSSFVYKLKQNEKNYNSNINIPYIINFKDINLIERYETYNILYLNQFKNVKIPYTYKNIISNIIINKSGFIYEKKDILYMKKQIKTFLFEYNLLFTNYKK